MFFLYAAKTKFPEIQFDDWSDLREEVILLSNHLLMNNFIFVNPGQIGLRSKKNINAAWILLIKEGFEDFFITKFSIEDIQIFL